MRKIELLWSGQQCMPVWNGTRFGEQNGLGDTIQQGGLSHLMGDEWSLFV